MCIKKPIKVFVIHRWDMAEWQAFIIKCLQDCSKFSIEDMSYSIEKPAPKHEFIQEYACGKMMASNFVIVLPYTPPGFYEDEESGNEYISTLFHRVGEARGIPHDAVYTTELQTLMFDACDNVPVLVIGWGNEEHDNLLRMLKNPTGIGGRYYNPDRFFYLNFDGIINSDVLSTKIDEILDKYVKQ